MRLPVKAVPNAKTSEILGWEDDSQTGRVLKIRVAAAAVDGKANEALRGFIAKSLGLPKSKVSLEKGSSSRVKMFSIPDGTDLSPLTP